MYVKGMVQVLGNTYRVTRVRACEYEVTRIRDEALIGSFACRETLEVHAGTVDLALMRLLASVAVQSGRTSWMGPSIKP